MIGILIPQLSLDIEAFILMNLMKDVELQDAGGIDTGDLLVIVEFLSMESFRRNREQIVHFLAQDITQNYGDFIQATLSVEYYSENGTEVSFSQYTGYTDYIHIPELPHIEDLENFLETLCGEDIFILNDVGYGDNSIFIYIQVDSYPCYLEYESLLVNFIKARFYDYQNIHISLSIGVYLIKGRATDQLSYLDKRDEILYGEEEQ